MVQWRHIQPNNRGQQPDFGFGQSFFSDKIEQHRLGQRKRMALQNITGYFFFLNMNREQIGVHDMVINRQIMIQFCKVVVDIPGG